MYNNSLHHDQHILPASPGHGQKKINTNSFMAHCSTLPLLISSLFVLTYSQHILRFSANQVPQPVQNTNEKDPNHCPHLTICRVNLQQRLRDPTSWHDTISLMPWAGVWTLQTPWRQLHNGHMASKGPKASQGGWMRGGREKEKGEKNERVKGRRMKERLGQRMGGGGLIEGGDKLNFWSRLTNYNSLSKA